jgi:hypothetical protein
VSRLNRLVVQDMSGEKYHVYEPAQSADPAPYPSAVYQVAEPAPSSADPADSQSFGLGSVGEGEASSRAPPAYLETNLDIDTSTEDRELVAHQPGEAA